MLFLSFVILLQKFGGEVWKKMKKSFGKACGLLGFGRGGDLRRGGHRPLQLNPDASHSERDYPDLQDKQLY